MKNNVMRAGNIFFRKLLAGFAYGIDLLAVLIGGDLEEDLETHH